MDILGYIAIALAVIGTLFGYWLVQDNKKHKRANGA